MERERESESYPARAPLGAPNRQRTNLRAASGPQVPAQLGQGVSWPVWTGDAAGRTLIWSAGGSLNLNPLTPVGEARLPRGAETN